MARSNFENVMHEASTAMTRIVEFSIDGLFGGPRIEINFSNSTAVSTAPSVLILAGRNGTGKTTVLRMISEMLSLSFKTARKVPFEHAQLILSSGDVLSIRPYPERSFPLWMQFNEHGVKLPGKFGGTRENESHNSQIEMIRGIALPILSSVPFELLELDRLPTSDRLTEEEAALLLRHSPARAHDNKKTVASRVIDFLREVQIDYHRFFREEELGFLPLLLNRLNSEIDPVTNNDLIKRVGLIKERQRLTSRFGLSSDTERLDILETLLSSQNYHLPQQIAIMQTHVETQEAAQRSRDNIAKRLINFERILSEFFIGKTVRVDYRAGIIIRASKSILSEEQLSSGEYHFLCMMVSALLCQRVGSIIAIDEPELSLHVSWQRKIVSALMDCASGAAPTFLFATHSLAISSEHFDAVQYLSALD